MITFDEDEDGVQNYADDIDAANGDLTPLPQDIPSEPSETELADETEALQ